MFPGSGYASQSTTLNTMEMEVLVAAAAMANVHTPTHTPTQYYEPGGCCKQSATATHLSKKDTGNPLKKTYLFQTC